MSGYVQVRIKSGANIGGQISHDSRRKKPAYVKRESEVIMMVYKTDADIYMNRQVFDIYGDNNGTIKYAQRHIQEEMQQRIKNQKNTYKEKHKRNMPKTANHFFKGIITFSHVDTVGGITNKKDRSSLDQSAEMFLASMHYMYGTYPLYLVRHEDETTVHYHFVAENFDYDKARTVQRALESKEFSNMQDLVAEAFGNEHYKRGEPKAETGAKHVKFQEWERQQITKANEEVKETARIVQNTKSSIVELKEMANDATNELLEILKLIVEKEKEIDKFKEVLQKYKDLRSLHIEANSAGLDDEAVAKLRKIEEMTGKTRKVLGIFKNELKELKAKRDELLCEVENKEMEILDTLDNTEEKIDALKSKKIFLKKNR